MLTFYGDQKIGYVHGLVSRPSVDKPSQEEARTSEKTMAVINTSTPPIGGWCNGGCFFNLTQTPAGATLVSDTGNDEANLASESYSGEVVIVQGGAPNYGQRTPVKVFVVSDNTIIIERTVPPGIQTATMTKQEPATLGETEYQQFQGGTTGPGANGEASVIRWQ